MCVPHGGNGRRFIAPLTFVAFGIPFLYVLDTFFQKLTASLASMNLAMASARAILTLFKQIF